MVDLRTVSCLRESEVDTIEMSLRKRMEEHISAGDLEAADAVEDTIKNLDKVQVCDEESDKTRGFSMMMRDRARYLY